MFIIWGHKLVLSAVPNSAGILGPSRKCPMRHCNTNNTCQLFKQEKYCHIYWIPCFPTGQERLVVQCMRCRAKFDFDEYKAFLQRGSAAPAAPAAPAAAAVGGNEAKLKALLEHGHFEFVEVIAREILKHEPMNVNVMSYLNVALNGCGKAKEADGLANQIVFHWQQHCRAEWISRGCPKGLAGFPRVLYNEGLPNYSLDAQQYFEPEAVNAKSDVAIYKIMVQPRQQSTNSKRLFKLLQSRRNTDADISRYEYELVEILPSLDMKTLISYAPASEAVENPPHIRRVASDVLFFLQNKSASAAENPVPRDLEVLDDGHGGFQFFSAAANADPRQRASTLKHAVATADWRSMRDFFAAMSRQDSSERSYWMAVVQGHIAETWSSGAEIDARGTMSPMLNGWLFAEPENVDCRLIRLKTYTAWAWHARTGALARAVSDRRLAIFHQRLLEAHVELKQAKVLCPSDPLLYEVAEPIIRGLKNHVTLCLTMEQALVALSQTKDPLFYGAHTSALQYHCRKWHGSHEGMFAYVKSITGQLPDGHPLWVLVPMAHYERSLIQPPKGYWQRSEVKKEIIEAFKHAFPSSGKMQAAVEKLHMQSQERACRSYFAYCFIMCQLYLLARSQIRALGKRPHSSPWHTMGKYKYYAGMLGFDTEGGPEDDIPMADASLDIPMAEASVIADELAAGNAAGSVTGGIGGAAATTVDVEPLTDELIAVPTAEAKVIPEIV